MVSEGHIKITSNHVITACIDDYRSCFGSMWINSLASIGSGYGCKEIGYNSAVWGDAA